MESVSSTKPAVWFWIVSGVALIWNLMGIGAFLVEAATTPVAVAGPENARPDAPLWYMAAFAVAVFGGVLGCIGLLLRTSWAQWLFVASLIGVALQQLYHFVLSDIGKGLSTADFVMTLMIPSVGVLLIWLSRYSRSKGWLR